MRFILGAALALLVAPGLAHASGIAVAEAQAHNAKVSRAELEELAKLYTSALQKAGAQVIAYGKGAVGSGFDFVSSLSVGRGAEGVELTALVSRLRHDTWSARAQTSVAAGDGAAVVAALDELASRIVEATNAAPPRLSGAPPRPTRGAAQVNVPPPAPSNEDAAPESTAAP